MLSWSMISFLFEPQPRRWFIKIPACVKLCLYNVLSTFLRKRYSRVLKNLKAGRNKLKRFLKFSSFRFSCMLSKNKNVAILIESDIIWTKIRHYPVLPKKLVIYSSVLKYHNPWLELLELFTFELILSSCLEDSC